MGILNILGLAREMLKTNKANASYVAKIQDRRLRAILRHAIQNSEFYRSRYKGINIENCKLCDLPVISKAEMMDNFDRFVTDKRLKYREVRDWLKENRGKGKLYLNEFIPVLTSGTTTETALVIYSRSAMDVVHAGIIARQPFVHEPSLPEMAKIVLEEMLVRKTRMAVIAVPGGPVHTMAVCTPAFHRFFLEEKIFSLLDPVEEIVRGLNDFQPDCLATYSSMIDILASEQLAGRLNIKFEHPRSFLIGCSEPLTETTKHLAWKAWKMRVQDTYGTSEWFMMGRSCNEFKNMHVMSDLCALEVVDRHNTPVQHGQLGEKVLLTNFFNFVQPFIRYEITDVTGYTEEACACGSPLPTIMPVQGRTDDILYIAKPEGGYEMLHHYVLLSALKEIEGVSQFQVAQTARNELTCYYVPFNKNQDIAPGLKRILENTLSKMNLHHCVILKFNQVDCITRHERSGKFKPIISLVDPPPDIENPFIAISKF